MGRDTAAPEGVWLSKAFDSAEAETHGINSRVEADIPDGTQIRISYFSSDSEFLPLQEERYGKLMTG